MGSDRGADGVVDRAALVEGAGGEALVPVGKDLGDEAVKCLVAGRGDAWQVLGGPRKQLATDVAGGIFAVVQGVIGCS